MKNLRSGPTIVSWDPTEAVVRGKDPLLWAMETRTRTRPITQLASTACGQKKCCSLQKFQAPSHQSISNTKVTIGNVRFPSESITFFP